MKKLFTDGGYQGPIFAKGQNKAMPSLVTEVVKRFDTAKDFENLSRNTLAFLKRTSTRLMLRRLCSK